MCVEVDYEKIHYNVASFLLEFCAWSCIVSCLSLTCCRFSSRIHFGGLISVMMASSGISTTTVQI